jgi:transposase
MVYRDQVLLGHLKTFVEKSNSEIQRSAIMDDGASIYKGACRVVRESSNWEKYLLPLNSPDFNLTEYIQAWIKLKISLCHSKITSQSQMKKIVLDL